MLKFTKKFRLEKERKEKISKIVQEVSDFERKNSVKITIKKFSEKKSLTKEENKIIDALLAKNEAEQNDLKPESEPSVSLVPTELNQGTNQEIQVKPFPTPSGVKLIDQLKEMVAKPRVLIDEKTINTEHTQTAKQENNQHFLVMNKEDLNRNRLKPAIVNSVTLNNNQAPSELDQIFAKFAKPKENFERKNNDTTEKEKVISSTTNVSPDQQSKLSNPTAVEGQLEQKNTDNIAASASEQTQNSQDNSSLLQKLQIGIENLKKREAPKQTNNLPIWAEIHFLLERLTYSTNEKEDEDLEFRLDEKISYQFPDQSNEEFVKQLASIKNSYYYDKIVPILKTLKRYLTSEKFEELNNEISAKNSEKQLDKKTFQELDLQAKSFNGCLSIILEKNINIDSTTSSDQSHSDASYTINDNKGTKSISAEFDKIEMQFQETVRQLEAFYPKQQEDQTLNDSNDKKVKFSENKTPTTIYFKTLPPIDNKDPAVVSATLKS